VWPPGSVDTVCPRPPLTLTFDRLTLKLVCESHLTRGTFLPNLGTLCLWVLELFAMQRRTDRQTDGKSNAYCPLFYGRGHNNVTCVAHCSVIWLYFHLCSTSRAAALSTFCTGWTTVRALYEYTMLLQQDLWPPGSADTICPRPFLMTQHFVSWIKKRHRWDVQTMWAYDLDLEQP